MDTTTRSPLSVVIVSAFIAVVLQLVVAPIITIMGVVPNFILIIVVITAMHNGTTRSTVMGFMLGLVYDLFSMGPIGGMTLLLTLLAYAVSSLSKGAFSGGIAVKVVALLVTAFAGEFVIAVIYAIVGFNSDFLVSLVRSVLPAVVYDAVIGLIFLFAYNALIGGESPRPGGGVTGRSLDRKLKM